MNSREKDLLKLAIFIICFIIYLEIGNIIILGIWWKMAGVFYNTKIKNIRGVYGLNAKNSRST